MERDGAPRGADVPSVNNILHTLSLPQLLGGSQKFTQSTPPVKARKANKCKCVASNSMCGPVTSILMIKLCFNFSLEY